MPEQLIPNPNGAFGYPAQSVLATTPVGMLTHSGPPISSDGAFQTRNIVFDNAGALYVCIASGTPGTWVCPGAAGTGIAHAGGTAQDTITTVEADLTGTQVSFDSPVDRALWVVGVVPAVSAATASATVTLKLTDGSNNQKGKIEIARSGTASRNFVPLILTELIPANSGTGIIRKIRGVCTSADGLTNASATGEVTLDVFVR